MADIAPYGADDLTRYRNDDLIDRIKSEELNFARDSYIAQLIPRGYFLRVGNHLHIGVAYGFYIETFSAPLRSNMFYSNVLVFEIDNGLCSSAEGIGNIAFETRVLFVKNYINITRNYHIRT